MPKNSCLWHCFLGGLCSRFSRPLWANPPPSSGCPVAVPAYLPLGLIIGNLAESPFLFSPPICLLLLPLPSQGPPAPLANKYKYPECLSSNMAGRTCSYRCLPVQNWQLQYQVKQQPPTNLRHGLTHGIKPWLKTRDISGEATQAAI